MMTIANQNLTLLELALSALNESLYLRHDKEEKMAPFVHLSTKTDSYIGYLKKDTDPILQVQDLLKNQKHIYTYITIGHESTLKDDNGNRVDAILITVFDVSQAKGIQIAQLFSAKNTGEFKKIGPIITLKSPPLIVSLHESKKDKTQNDPPHFDTEIRTNDRGLKSIHTKISHDSPSLISQSISHFLSEKIKKELDKSFGGCIEINIYERSPIHKKGLLKFLCTNTINEFIDSKSCKIWIKKHKKALTVTCNFNKDLLYQAKARKDKPRKFKLGTNNYIDFNKSELDKEYNEILIDFEKNTDTKSILKLSKLNSEFNKRGLHHPSQK